MISIQEHHGDWPFQTNRVVPKKFVVGPMYEFYRTVAASFRDYAPSNVETFRSCLDGYDSPTRSSATREVARTYTYTSAEFEDSASVRFSIAVVSAH